MRVQKSKDSRDRFRVHADYACSLLDHFVSGHKQSIRYFNAQHLRGSEINRQLELGRLLDRQISGRPRSNRARRQRLRMPQQQPAPNEAHDLDQRIAQDGNLHDPGEHAA